MKAVAAIMLMTAVVCATGCKKPENQNEESVTLTTLTPQNITPTSADLGAKISFSDGIEPRKLGVCWGLNENPGVGGNYRLTDNCSEPFVCTITNLKPNTTYHVRAYLNYFGQQWYSKTIFGDDITFTTPSL